MPTGSRRWQAFSAVLSWELLTRSCRALGNFALLAPAWGSLALPQSRSSLTFAQSMSYLNLWMMGCCRRPLATGPGPPWR